MNKSTIFFLAALSFTTNCFCLLIEYGGISIKCKRGCGSSQYDTSAYEILKIFNTCTGKINDLYPNECGWGMFKSDKWYNENSSWENLIDNSDTICHRQADFLKDFKMVQEKLQMHHREYYKYLNQQLEIHQENIRIIPEIAAREECNWVKIDCWTNKVVGPGYGVAPYHFYFQEVHSALNSEIKIRDNYLIELKGDNDFERAILMLDNMYLEIDGRLKNIFFYCLENHQPEGIVLKQSVEALLQQNFFEAMELIRRLIEILEAQGYSPNAIGKIHLIKGQLQAEFGLYVDAISSLTDAIGKNPDQKEAYLERAGAYFELGNFDKAIEDYLNIGTKYIPSTSRLEWLNAAEMSAGIAAGIVKGSGEGLVEFLPETLSSLHGLCHGLWAFCSHPIGASKEFVRAATNCVEYLKQHSTQQILQTIVPELRDLIQRYDQLGNFEKGELIGHVVGKYGTDIFLTAGSTTAIKYYRDLKRANQLMTLEALASELGKEQVLKQILEYELKNAELLKKFKNDQAFVRTLKNKQLPEITIRKTLHELGYSTFPRPKNLPSNYIATFSEGGCGMKYIDPINPHNYVRVMPGNPLSPNPCQHNPYITHMRNGKNLDISGMFVESYDPEAHIPIEKFIYRHQIEH